MITAQVQLQNAVPTAATAIAGNQEFFTWIHVAVSAPEFQQLYIFLVVGLVGIVAHFLKRKLEGELAGNFWNYLFGSYTGRTLTALGTFVGSAFTYVYTGAADGITWPALIGLAFSTGYMVDSSINKGTKVNGLPEQN